MCTYNGSRHLLTQLETISSQTSPPDELVVCDDGSDDETISLLTGFAGRAAFPVRLFSNSKRMGPTKNFEQAIQCCEGDIIVLSDQDDIWKPSKLEKLVSAFDRDSEAVFVFSDAEMGTEEGEQTGRTLWDSLKARRFLNQSHKLKLLNILLKRNIVTGATMAFRASFRNAVVPIPPEWMHDYWIVLLGSVFHSGVSVPEALMIYRQHSNQVCGWGKRTFRQVIQESLDTTSESCSSKVTQYQKLVDRIRLVSQTTPCPGNQMRLVEEKLKHLRQRCAIRSSDGPSRVAHVLKEALSGRYTRCSGSWHSIVRDLWFVS
jgi:hypothetical protein